MSRHQGLTLAELEARGANRQQPALAAAQHQVNVVKGLVEMRKAGLLQAIHADQGLLAIRLPVAGGPGPKHRITWADAERLVAKFQAGERVDSRNMGIQKKPPEHAKTLVKRRRSGR